MFIVSIEHEDSTGIKCWGFFRVKLGKKVISGWNEFQWHNQATGAC